MRNNICGKSVTISAEKAFISSLKNETKSKETMLLSQLSAIFAEKNNKQIGSKTIGKLARQIFRRINFKNDYTGPRVERYDQILSLEATAPFLISLTVCDLQTE
jgi:hypothetical protein